MRRGGAGAAISGEATEPFDGETGSSGETTGPLALAKATGTSAGAMGPFGEAMGWSGMN